MGYTSQDETIYARADALGISHDAIYDYFDKMANEVNEKYPGKSPDWRIEKAEQSVWSMFFPNEPFPCKTSDIAASVPPAIPIVEKPSKISATPLCDRTCPVKVEHGSESLNPVEPSGGVQIKVEHSSSPAHPQPRTSQSLTSSQRLGFYTSQSKLITSKAFEKGVDLAEFRKTVSEKEGIAQTRFPGESAEWQAWLAESLVWSFYFKESPFPGVEPERLYSLRSSNMEESHKRPDISSSGEKWRKYDDPDHSAKRVVTSGNIVDSYRPSHPPSPARRTTTDRAIPLPVDSYRPSSSGAPRPMSTTTSNGLVPNRSTAMNNSVKSEMSNTSSSSVLNRSTTSNNLVLSRSTSLSNSPGLPVTGYMMQEAFMEKKAKSLGIRREFFQYLQRKRDEVRIQHPNCSPQYRHFAADSLVWARFFKKDPFPFTPPRGLDLHLPPCSMSASGSKSASSSERLSTLQAPRGPSQSVSSSERLSTSHTSGVPSPSLSSSERLSPSQAPRGPSQSLTSSERLPILDQSNTSSGESTLILVNQKVFKCSAAKSQELLQLFYTDKAGLSALEVSLGCRFTYCFRTPDQSIIDFRANPTSSKNSDSYKAVRRVVNHFLECWVDKLLTHERADPNSSPSKYYWNQYHQRKEMEDRFNGQIIIHGDKYGSNPSKVIVACPSSSLSQISYGLHPEGDIMPLMRAQHELNFQIRELHRPDSKSLEALAININITPIHKKGVDDVNRSCIVIQTWVMKALRDPAYSLLAHLKQQIQVKQPVVTDPKPNSALSVSDSDSDWERYASTFKASELDRLMIEEAVKVEGPLRMVLDEASGQVVGLKEYSKRILGRAANRSPHLNYRESNGSEDREPNHSNLLNDSEGSAGKRKLEEDIVMEGLVEKKARV